MSVVTRLALLLCLLPLALASAQGEPLANLPDGGEVGFVETFGEPGADGSFRVRFSRAGGGIVHLHALDHYVSLATARKDEHDDGDYLLLVDHNDHALRLFHEPRSAAVPVDPATALWTREAIAGGVRFVLDSTTGLVLEKVLRHDPEGRGFTIELRLRNEGSAAVGDLSFVLGGPALVNAAQSSLFGDVSVAIAVPAGGDAQFVKPSPGAVQQLTVDPASLQFAGSTNRFFGAFPNVS
jgi:hypothetical protein